MLEPAWNKLKQGLKKELPPDQVGVRWVGGGGGSGAVLLGVGMRVGVTCTAWGGGGVGGLSFKWVG